VPKSYGAVDLGGVLTGVQPGTGRVLYMAQNKTYSQDPDVLNTSNEYTSINYATDQQYGGSGGFQVGSTYKVFTLAEWLKQGHSLNETVNANIRTYNQASFKDTCPGADWTGPYKPTNDSGGEDGIRSAQSATTLSINTAFVAMAYQLDLCEIKKDAEAFGVHTAKGEPLSSNPASVLGTNNIAPLTMATAFAGIANNGMTCTPIAIDKIVDGTGKDVTPPASKCTQAVDPAVANTMAKALQGPLQSGTAAGMNRTGKDMLGKTGTTDGNEQLWLVAATTKVAGAYWVGNISGHQDMRRIYPTHGTTPAIARTAVMRAMMTAAVAKYGGDPFPAAPDKLIRGVQVAIPDLAGKTPDEAKAILTGLGLDSADGPVQDSVAPAGTIAATDPPAGTQVSKGTPITLFTSNGSLVAVPNVVGQKYGDALAALTAAGFTVKTTGGNNPASIVQAQDPAAGAPAKRGAQVTLALAAVPSTPPTPGH
jgi:membrane peptidoglycan carboxypeptidase